jgi:hypothetical protein
VEFRAPERYTFVRSNTKHVRAATTIIEATMPQKVMERVISRCSRDCFW